ncbi:reductive dehalogenase [Desulfitibacter alkalitolerans]|uniref:reductive dehalogenase n=1 Tax=Desulfitibacter alkalitolerans TaxID=264641 RepID=UPI0006846877|nr:reductive dehalogenase [Desulfitibacter alkalitolerans]
MSKEKKEISQEASPSIGISRRDLFKGTAVVGAGTALTMATAKTVEASSNAKPVEARKNWYVKTVSQITTPYDLSKTKRFDERNGSVRGPGYRNYVGDAKENERAEAAKELRDRGIREEIPGWTLLDQALASASGMSSFANSTFLQWTPVQATTPQERGYDPYNVAPEIAAKHLKHAARALGAAKVGITALRKEWTYSVGGDGRRIEFENVNEPYETEEKRVIPEKVKNMIVLLIPQPVDAIYLHQTAIGGSYTGNIAYRLGAWTIGALAEFIRWLGYTAIPCQNNTFITVPHAIEAGMGELGRHNRMVCPDYSLNNRLFPIATDMPLAHDKPIDFGLIDFCKTCMKCAEHCPAKAISFEREPTWETKGPWNNPGHKAWFDDAVKCRWNMTIESCANCQASCTYTKKNDTVIHAAIKGTIANTRALNGMFVRFDDMFGYGFAKDPKKWWDIDLPRFGHYEL